MNQDEIVNRTPETWGLRQESDRLNSNTVEDAVTAIKQFGDTIRESVPDLKASENAVTSNFPVTAESARAGETLARTLLAQTPRDPDLKIFRQQVISAFKHLGLDTNKFFGK